MTTSSTKPRRTPSHYTPAYVCRAIRKIFAARGMPLYKVAGRYTPYFSQQCATEGYSVQKIGCSKTVCVSYNAARTNGRAHNLPKEVRLQKEREARELLASLGYRIDERGWIECDHYDDHDR